MVSGGVLDDLVVGQLEGAAGLIPLRSAVADGDVFHQRGVLAVVLRVARLGWHLVGIFGRPWDVRDLDWVSSGLLLSRR